MSVEKVRNYLREYGFEDRVREFDVSTATVAEAAEAVGVIPAQIAKTLSFESEGSGCLLILMAGDAKVDNKKYRSEFGTKPHMLSHEDALCYTGHAVGGVCPFAVPEDIPVYLDVSLKRFETVFPAAGSAASAVRLNCDELERASRSRGWVDVCKDWGEDQTPTA